MAGPAKINEEMVEAALKITQQAKTVRQLRKGLSIVLPGALGASNAKIAKVLGVGSATVVRLQKEIREEVAGTARKRANGGDAAGNCLPLRRKSSFWNHGPKRPRPVVFCWSPRSTKRWKSARVPP